MSGRSWDYFYFKVEEAAERLKTSECMHRMMLGHLMDKVAKAMFNIEWVDSGDKCKEEELESIKAIFKTNYSELSYNELKTRIDKHIESMLKEIFNGVSNVSEGNESTAKEESTAKRK